MRTKSLHLIGLIVLTVAALRGQSTPIYWSTTQPDCTSLNNETPVAITNASGATIGYSCHVAGTFVWLAAGGGWSTAIRVAAPASAAIGVNYFFYDTNGNDQSLDTAGAVVGSSTGANFALSANQPSEINLRGATNNAPNYGTTATGSVYAVFYCPDAATCNNVLPQLIYSALPLTPWSLSVPIAWDTLTWTQYSGVGIDDGRTRRVSFVVYNEDTVAVSFRINIYNSDGVLAGSGTTPLIAPLKDLGNGALGEGGTYGALLSEVITTPLPSGPFKILIDGGTRYSAVEMLQIDGASATTLQVAYDSAPSTTATAAVLRRANIRRSRVPSSPVRAFEALPR